MELVIASHNVQKIFEIREMIKDIGLDIDVISLFDFSQYSAKHPLSETLLENATIKAEHAAKALNKPCLADDSSLIIPVIGGAKTTLKKRQEALSNQRDMTKALLGELRPYKELDRSAYLECCLALCLPNGTKQTATGRIEGVISEVEKGKAGFEFDTIFQRHDYSKTMGELPFSVRIRISHRRKAFEKIACSLEQFALNRK